MKIPELEQEIYYAWIKVNGKSEIAYVDKGNSQRAYKLTDGGAYSLKHPLEEIKDFEFVRWCTGMDL